MSSLILWSLLIWLVLVYANEIAGAIHTVRNSRELKRRANTLAMYAARVKQPFSSIQPFAPPVTLIVPLKGLDPGLEDNLRSLAQQDYPDYKTIFVVDNDSDPASSIAKKLPHASIIIAKKFPHASGKVAALLSALPYISTDFIAFADSDIRAHSMWLRSLIAPLADPSVGVSTGYRWYVSDGSFASCLRSAWNCIGLSTLTSRFSFVWGGSFALRRSDMEHWNIAKQWETAISDDTIVTSACRADSKHIFFSPRSVVLSGGPVTFSQLLEWTTRQVWFVRHSDKRAWWTGIAIYGLSTLTLIFGVAALAASLMLGKSWYLYTILLLFPQLINILKASHRFRVFSSILPEYKKEMSLHKTGTTLAEMLVRPLAFYNIIRTKTMRSIRWRGRTYFKPSLSQ